MKMELVRQSLARIYGTQNELLEPQMWRYRHILDEFHSRFGADMPATIVRAPGRVNLIGEHTDYNGYPVLPMAIDRDILIAFSPVPSSRVTVENLDQHFPRIAFEAASPVPRDPQGSWGNYVKAAVQGVLASGLITLQHPNGFNALCTGSVPPSSGLSSSSALVVATGLTLLAANATSYESRTLAEILTKAERYAGMEGGGMDQTVSLMGTAGHALKIDFFPIALSQVALPPGYVFVVCNSLVAAPKAASARDAYNRRVVECRLAAAILAKHLVRDGRRIERLAELAPSSLGVSETRIAETSLRVLHATPWRLSEIAEELGIADEDLIRTHCTTGTGSVVPQPEDGFRLFQRYRHVTSEARRVVRATAVLQSGDAASFGELMNESHMSCRDDYEISCPELESLVSIARDNGAIGARLTGAGFGGCTVNMVEESNVSAFIQGMRHGYYAGLPGLDGAATDAANIIFPCRAVQGAGIVMSEDRNRPEATSMSNQQ